MSKLEELQEKQRACMITNVSMKTQFDGIMTLYESAAIHPNLGLMEIYSDQLHELLQHRLDNTRAMMEYTRQMIQQALEE